MTTTLHITNGDALTQLLQRSDFKGEIVTWREMLCEGRTTTDVGSESFWKQRFEFLNSRYRVTKKKFIDLTLKEYRNLCNYKQQQEIVLWFEDDLFCQVNMLAVMSWLLKHRKGADIFLVKLQKKDRRGQFIPLSQLQPADLEKSYRKRTSLDPDDLEYADYIWQLYCEKNPLLLQKAIANPNEAFPHLSNAIKAHYQRFPSVKNGLNRQENKMLQLAHTANPADTDALVAAMLKEQDNYGYGDLQYQRMAKRLSGLFASVQPVKLNNTGMDVLKTLTNFYPVLRNDEDYLGGAPKYSFLYFNETEQLLKL